jgi:hypothetical protein
MNQAMRMLTRNMMTLSTAALLGAGLIAGCDRNDSTTATPANSGTGLSNAQPGKDVTGPAPGSETGSNPGGAPSFGQATGTGFSTGDAAHSGGQGGGLMGYHGTGSAGTSGAITDPRVDVRDPSRGVIVEPPIRVPTTEPSAGK